MSDTQVVDWRLAGRIASAVAGDGDGVVRPEFDQRSVEAAYDWALPVVLAYARLEPAGEIPAPEVVDRDEWIRGGLAMLRELSGELEARLAGPAVPGPLGSLVRGLVGATAGAEAGVAVGYAARKVLGQYDVSLLSDARPPRLVFVGPNLAGTHAQLGGDPDAFLRWIAAHETTHAVQFASVPWLRDHLAGLIRELISGASAGIDAGALAGLARRLLTTDPRVTMRRVLRGELPRLLFGPGQDQVVDLIQATMALIEGHAEHVMDAALGEENGLAELRRAIDARRASRGGIGEVIARLLGLDLKIRQYTLGKAFCDSVVAKAGIDGLNAAWRDAASLPSLAELEAPEAWLNRVAQPAAA